MKNSVLILLVLFFFASCEKYNEEKKVQYLVTKSVSGFQVNYKSETGDMVKEDIVVGSETDQWKYTFMAERGDVIYVSALDTLPTSFVNVRILVNGKVYKQASRNDDNTKPVVVSGTVPY